MGIIVETMGIGRGVEAGDVSQMGNKYGDKWTGNHKSVEAKS